MATFSRFGPASSQKRCFRERGFLYLAPSSVCLLCCSVPAHISTFISSMPLMKTKAADDVNKKRSVKQAEVKFDTNEAIRQLF